MAITETASMLKMRGRARMLRTALSLLVDRVQRLSQRALQPRTRLVTRGNPL